MGAPGQVSGLAPAQAMSLAQVDVHFQHTIGATGGATRTWPLLSATGEFWPLLAMRLFATIEAVDGESRVNTGEFCGERLAEAPGSRTKAPGYELLTPV